jgi:hypothetical protein
MKKLFAILAFGLCSTFAFSQSLPCPHFICEQDLNQTLYAVPATAGSTYEWTVTGGTISSGQGTNSIQVDWQPATPGLYLVAVRETDINGCEGQPVTCEVTITPTPVTGVITHD